MCNIRAMNLHRFEHCFAQCCFWIVQWSGFYTVPFFLLFVVECLKHLYTLLNFGFSFWIELNNREWWRFIYSMCGVAAAFFFSIIVALSFYHFVFSEAVAHIINLNTWTSFYVCSEQHMKSVQLRNSRQVHGQTIWIGTSVSSWYRISNNRVDLFKTFHIRKIFF